MAVPADELDEVAELVSGYPEVNHNYEREHELNLWFVVTAPSRERVEVVLRRDRDTDQAARARPAAAGRLSAGSGVRPVMALNDPDRRLIAAIQDGLPLAPRPYAAIGERIGIREAEVIAGLRRLIDDGVIKRFGVIVRHRALGYRANAMVVWDVAG